MTTASFPESRVGHGLSASRPGYVALCAALFTFSWDKVASFYVGGYNVKISTILFLLAALGSLGTPRTSPVSRFQSQITGLLLIILAWLVIVCFFAEHTGAAVAQTARNSVATLIPLAAVSGSIRNHVEWERALQWIVRGVVVAAVFGAYQLFAFYAGLPQFVSYSGQSGGVGRISAFNYEPAVFGQVLLIGVAAMMAQRTHRPHRLVVAFGLGITIVLTNARALFITVPLFFLLVRQGRLSVRARRVIPVASSLIILLALLVAIVSPDKYVFLRDQFLSIFNPNEVASNSRRLAQFRIDIWLIRENGFLGIGPANLYHEIQGISQTVFDGDTPNTVVANNTWLQALLDGGVVLLILEVSLSLMVVRFWWRFRRDPSIRSIAACWVSISAVSNMLFSQFFAPATWMLIGLMCAYASLRSSPTGPRIGGVRPPFLRSTSH